MTDTGFTHEDHRKIAELYDAIVGTTKEDGLRSKVNQIREDLDEHREWNHEDAKEVAASAATAAVIAHEQQPPHLASRRGSGFWRRLGFDVLSHMLASAGGVLLLGILALVIWLGPLLDAIAKLAHPAGHLP